MEEISSIEEFNTLLNSEMEDESVLLKALRDLTSIENVEDLATVEPDAGWSWWY